MSEQKNPDDEFVEREFVIVGRTRTTEKKPGVILRRLGEVQHVGEDGELGPEEVYSAKPLLRKPIGAVYVIEATATSIRPTTARYLRQYHDRDKVMTWQAEARAQEIIEQAARDEKKGATPAALKALEPLRRLYARTNHLNRLAIEVQVLAYLRSYPRLDTLTED